MFIINTVFGGLLGGVLCAFLVAWLATVPRLGWLDVAVEPMFWLGGLAIGLLLGWKTYPSST